MTEGTITPEVQIKQLEEALATETDRLQKLFAAYETQEKELVDAKAEIEVLEKEIIDREIEKESLESIIAEKDVRVRELEMKATKNSKRVEHLEPELEKMEEKYSREKDRLGKVFGIAEELDNDLRLAVTEMKARDDWYVDHMQIFEDLNKAIAAALANVQSGDVLLIAGKGHETVQLLGNESLPFDDAAIASHLMLQMQKETVQ